MLQGTQRHMLGFVKLGAKRTFEACSYANPAARSLPSEKAPPTNVTPIGLRPAPPVP